MKQRVLLAIAVLLTLLFIPLGVVIAIQDFTWGYVDGDLEPRVSFVLECLGLLGTCAVLFGLYRTTRSPKFARTLVIVGAVAMCGIGWFAILPPILALLVLGIGVSRANKYAQWRNISATPAREAILQAPAVSPGSRRLNFVNTGYWAQK